MTLRRPPGEAWRRFRCFLVGFDGWKLVGVRPCRDVSVRSGSVVNAVDSVAEIAFKKRPFYLYVLISRLVYQLKSDFLQSVLIVYHQNNDGWVGFGSRGSGPSWECV